MKYLSAVPLVAATIIAGNLSAHAADVWTCTYPGYSADHGPVIVRFREIDAFFVEGEFEMKFRILQNNQFAVETMTI
jgi:hypothetical protein